MKDPLACFGADLEPEALRQSAEARLCELRRVSCELSFRMLTCCDFECHDRMSRIIGSQHSLSGHFLDLVSSV